MKKIPTLFVRDPRDRSRLLDEVTPGCEWVVAGEGIATLKLDGTACLYQDDRLWKRYELRPGRTVPEDFIPAQGADPKTNRQPGWVPVGDGPEDQYHREAIARCARLMRDSLPEGTYELIGPKIQGNAECVDEHQLVPHGAHRLSYVPVNFDGLRLYLLERRTREGIVWHHPDGRMVKIKRRDFCS